MKRVTVFIFIVLSLFVNANAEINPSKEQLEMFKKLPFAQQVSLAEHYGIDISKLQPKTKSSKEQFPSLNELVLPRAPTEDKNVDVTKEPLANSEEDATEELVSQFSSEEDDTELKAFGYNLFSGEPSTFAPVSDVPVPDEYILGPGDTVNIQLYGKESKDLSLTVNRRGAIELPSLGPYQVAGQSFAELSSQLKEAIQERMIGMKSNISMGALRSIRVFVLGEAYKPASYTLSSLSTVTQAIYAAGGINDIGSLRNIQVKRRNKVIAELDLYDLLLKGDTSADIRLLSGDVVFIPTIGKTVGIKGEVIRPAIYELRGTENLEQVLNIAGGLKATAFEKIIKLQRINKNGLRSIINIDLNATTQRAIYNGDMIEVAAALNTLETNVTVKGHIERPGVYGWRKGMQLSDLLRSINDFKEQADLEYILVARTAKMSGELTTFGVDFTDFIVNGNKSADFKLESQDIVYVFNKDTTRTFSLTPVIKRLKEQTKLLEPPKVVTISGAVKNPGEYPLTHKANVMDLLKAAMGYEQNAELEFVLIAHTNQENFQTEIRYLDLTQEANKLSPLSPLDRIFVFDRTSARTELLAELNQELKQQANKEFSQNVVTIHGDVRFPGEYPFTQSSNIEQLIKLAGNMNESSYLVDAELTRFFHDGKQNAEIEHINVDLESNKNFKLKPLDTLFIKRIPKWRNKRAVKLSGEVVFPGEYVIQQGETLAQVISRAGGLTKEADLHAAIFTRESLRLKEQKQIERISEELKAELTSLKVDKSDDSQDISAEEAELLAKRLDNTSAVGRLVIDLPRILAAVDSDTGFVRLDDGDALYIPKKRQSISVLGEVQYPTSHLFSVDIDIDEYIDKSGGTKPRADSKRIYVIKSDGSVYMPVANTFFARVDELSPGDTIVVPLDTEYRDNLTLWSTATQILYNTAVAVAAISAL